MSVNVNFHNITKFFLTKGVSGEYIWYTLRGVDPNNVGHELTVFGPNGTAEIPALEDYYQFQSAQQKAAAEPSAYSEETPP